MLEITKLEESVEIFKALGSEVRLQLLELLREYPQMNLNELAAKLGITNGALTGHMKKLERAGLVQVTAEGGGHGNGKVCRILQDDLLIHLQGGERQQEQSYDIEIPVGHYIAHEVCPTCGIATHQSLVGEVDDPRAFTYPERFEARILWFTKGYVEYEIPNQLPGRTVVDRLTLSMEISSEAPGVNSDWPSEITFQINETQVGTWVSPGDFGDVPGVFTPDWWLRGWNQYGLRKTLTIDRAGTFLDGRKISEITIRELQLDYQSRLHFRMQAEERNGRAGGLTIFGREFGNYNQDIQVQVSYEPVSEEK